MLDHLRGIIELDGQCVPVIDPSIQICAERTEIGHCSCILVVEHKYGSKRLRTGVIVNDIEEVMQLAAGTFRSSAEPAVSVNAHFLVEACHSTGPHELLAATHRELGPLNEEHARLCEATVMNGVGVGSEDR
jgi:chemotaxis signal transduction protein